MKNIIRQNGIVLLLLMSMPLFGMSKLASKWTVPYYCADSSSIISQTDREVVIDHPKYNAQHTLYLDKYQPENEIAAFDVDRRVAQWSIDPNSALVDGDYTNRYSSKFAPKRHHRSIIANHDYSWLLVTSLLPYAVCMKDSGKIYYSFPGLMSRAGKETEGVYTLTFQERPGVLPKLYHKSFQLQAMNEDRFPVSIAATYNDLVNKAEYNSQFPPLG